MSVYDGVLVGIMLSKFDDGVEESGVSETGGVVRNVSRARMNAACNSGGMSADNPGLLFWGSCSGSGSVSGAGDASTVFANKCDSGIFGTGIVTRGFLLRMISVVVATYIGSADNINMPNTNPGNPSSLELNRRCHWAPLNMLKLNKKKRIAHIIDI